MNADILPPWDQKAYDLGARLAREVIDHLHAELAAKREVVHLLSRTIDEICADRDQDLDTIRNQNSHMAWLEGQLQEGAARERAYCEAINDLCDEVTRIHARAKAVLEGRSEQGGAVRRHGNGSCGSGHVSPLGSADLGFSS